MTARLDISLISALCLLLAVTFCSCSQIYDEEGPCEQEQNPENRVSLKFKIYTEASSSTPTRTRGLGVWEEESANIAERILNPQDVRVLLLNADHHFVKSFRPNKLDYVEGTAEEGGITGDGYYELSVFFEDDNLDRMDDDSSIYFDVVILANINSLGGIYTTDALTAGSARDKIQELFTMPRDWFPSNSKGIPMYGYKNGITVTKAQLADENYNMGDITMLRALCKIEVIDNVDGVEINGQKYPYVEKVELISWRNKGYLRPSETGLSLTNIPNPASPPTTDQTVDATYITDNDDKDKGRFRIYCPEAKLEEVAIRVTATLAPDIYKSYEVSLGQYADGDKANPVFGNDLVRNHIYRFNVNSFNVPTDLTVTVSEWGKQTDDYTLDDIIEMDDNGYLRWTNIENNPNFSVTDEPYNGKTEKQLSILGGTTDYATGTFHIQSPQGAVWRAYFIPGENGVDAFEFVTVDATGNVTSTSSFVEGVIDGSPATINIRGKGQADAYRHTAELVVEVHQPDGTVLYAPLTNEGSSRFIIYRENKL